jgi:hypothetical protein
MAGMAKTNLSGPKHFAVDSQALDKLEQQALGEGDLMLSDGSEYNDAIQAFIDLGRNAFLLSKTAIGQLVPGPTLNKGARLVRSGDVERCTCDGSMIGATVKDGNSVYYPALSVDISSASCGCAEVRARHMCSHIAALMLAWNQDFTRFVPPPDTPAVQGQQFMVSQLGVFLRRVTNQNTYAAAMAAWCRLLSPAENNPSISDEKPRTSVSSGVGFWPVAPKIKGDQSQLRQIIDQEYNATQLRELGRWLNLKLKGTSKSALIDQVVDALAVRVKEMRQNPAAMLEGLSDEYAAFVRRMLTARDFQLPVPRTVARAIWATGPGSEQDKAFGAALDELRRRAILFPTLRQYDYRDVYYQWLPLEESRGNVPRIMWPRGAVALAESGAQACETDAAPFLDTLNAFMNAILATGTEIRPTLSRHPKANTVDWLKNWEHESDEAERLLHSRPGWVPNPQSGISVPLIPWLSLEARARLENQTGLPARQCAFLFDVATALQLIDAPDSYRQLDQTPERLIPLTASWRLNARISAVEAWLARTDEGKFVQAFDAWREGMLFGYEAWSVCGENPKDSFKIMRSIGARSFLPGNLGTEWCALRRFVLRALRGLPAETWIDWPAFQHQLFQAFAGDAWRVYSSDTWWFSNEQVRYNTSNEPDWQRTVGAVIETMLREPLYWFGIVEVMPDAQKGLRAFRLTEMLDWLSQVEQADPAEAGGPRALPALPMRQMPRPQKAEPITWLNDTQWCLPPAPDRAEMIVFAHKIAEPADARFTYQLTPASIERALTQGVSADDAIRLFESSGAPMPPAAQALFKMVADRFGRVRVYESLSVLELADDYALRELVANTSLEQHIVYHISPRAVVVKTEAIDALMAEMVARGYTPGED